MQPESLTCNAIMEQIDGLSQKGLKSALRSGPVQEHVQHCTACRSYLEKTLALVCHLDTWQVPEPKKDICAGVMTQIAQMERNRRASSVMLLKEGIALLNVRLRVPAAAAAILMAALVVSVTLNIRGIHTEKAATPGDIVSNASPIGSMTDDTSTVTYLYTDQPDLILSYMSSAALAPSTFVVILGAPPFSVFETPGGLPSATPAGTGPSDDPSDASPGKTGSQNTDKQPVHL
jgi:hypothetical protein